MNIKNITIIYRLLFLFMLAIQAIVVVSCIRDSAVENDFDKAESMINELPDSALSILRGIDKSCIKSKAEQARYALLTTGTRLSLGEDLTGDTMMDIVLTYYQTAGNIRHKALACYYKGYILYRSGNYAEALPTLLESFEAAGECNDTFRQAKAASLLGSLYFMTYNPEIGLKYSEESYNLFLDARAEKEADNELMNIMSFHHAIGNHDKAEEMAPVIARKAKDSGNTALRHRALQSLANTLMHTEKHADAKAVFEIMVNEGIMDTYDSCLCIFTDVKLGNLSSAREMIRSISIPDSVSQLTLGIESYYLALGDTVRAFKYLDMYDEYISKAFTDKYNDGILTNIEKFYKTGKELQKAQLHAEKMAKRTIIIASSIILLIIVWAFRWRYNTRLRIKDAELDARMERIQALTTTVIESQSDALRMSHELDDTRRKLQQATESAMLPRDIISQLFRNQWKTLNILCNEYFEKGDTALRATILTEVEKEISRIKGRQGVKSIAEALDRHFNNIISRLQSQLPELSDSDRTFLIFLYAGFSPRAICLFTGYTLRYYYKKRTVLKEKLLSSDAPDRLQFAEMMG